MLSVLTALWLGVLTSLSPCPLATNAAAVGWLTGAGTDAPGTVRAGLLYGLGRAVTYSLLGGLLGAGLLAAVDTSRFLQHDLNRVLGPVLVLGGMLILGLLPVRVPGLDLEGAGRRVVARGGPAGAFLLGLVFALSFCPVSAALFFGSLLPLTVSSGSPWLLPAVYGVGTTLPVLALALLLAFGAGRLGRAFRRVEVVERLGRRLTGTLFVGAGLYLSWIHVLRPALIR